MTFQNLATMSWMVSNDPCPEQIILNSLYTLLRIFTSMHWSKGNQKPWTDLYTISRFRWPVLWTEWAFVMGVCRSYVVYRVASTFTLNNLFSWTTGTILLIFFTVSFWKNFSKSFCLKPQGLELRYLVWNIALWTSNKTVQIMAPWSKFALSRLSDFF